MTEGHGETPLGWVRLAMIPVVYGLVPLWLLGGVVVSQVVPSLREGPILHTMVSALGFSAAVLIPLVVVVGLGMAVGGLAWRMVSGWGRARDARRYDAIVGDGGVMRSDAWPDAVTPAEGPEEPVSG